MRHTIAIFRTGGVGDVILSTISINIIRHYIPDARILWFGRKSSIGLIRDMYTGVEVHELAETNSYRQNLRIIKAAAGKLHAVIDLQHSARTILLGRIAAIHSGCSYTSWNKYSIERSLLVIQSHLKGRKFSFDWFPRELPNRYMAMAACTISALKKIIGITGEPGKWNPVFPVSRTREAKVAICLGAKFLAKALPVSHIEQLLEEIVQDKKIQQVVFLGDTNQKEQASDLISRYNDRIRLLNRCGETSLTEAALELATCRYAIVNDSGLAHLAEAVNTPVLMFFGPTHQKFGYRPHHPASRILAADLGCRPCNKNGDVTCRYHDHACSASIKPEELRASIKQMPYA
jgi:ADP-heptose:LPS heptosyltransferase